MNDVEEQTSTFNLVVCISTLGKLYSDDNSFFICIVLPLYETKNKWRICYLSVSWAADMCRITHIIIMLPTAIICGVKEINNNWYNCTNSCTVKTEQKHSIEKSENSDLKNSDYKSRFSIKKKPYLSFICCSLLNIIIILINTNKYKG